MEKSEKETEESVYKIFEVMIGRKRWTTSTLLDVMEKRMLKQTKIYRIINDNIRKSERQKLDEYQINIEKWRHWAGYFSHEQKSLRHS